MKVWVLVQVEMFTIAHTIAHNISHVDSLLDKQWKQKVLPLPLGARRQIDGDYSG